MPKSISKECNDFVNEYADTIIQLLIEATVPSEICRMMHMCGTTKIEEAKGNNFFNFYHVRHLVFSGNF